MFCAAEVPALQGVLSVGSTQSASSALLRRTCLSQTEQSGKSAPLGAKTGEPNYFSGSQNSQRVKEWRKRNPGYWRKKNPTPQEPLQDLCTTQVAQDEQVKRIEISDALQDVLVMQPAVMVGLISMMTGSALQEDIAATTRALLSKGQDILGRRLWSHNDALPR